MFYRTWLPIIRGVQYVLSMTGKGIMVKVEVPDIDDANVALMCMGGTKYRAI